MTLTDEDAMRMARSYSFKVCYRKPDWDADDLWGDILLRYVQYPPKDEREMWICCKFASADWMRRKFGRSGWKSEAVKWAPSYYIDPQDGTAVSMIEEHVADDASDIIDMIHSDAMLRSIPRVWKGRDLVIVEMLVGGYTLREIGEVLGVTESRVSQIVTKRVKPKAQRLDGMLNVGNSDGGHRTGRHSGSRRDTRIPVWAVA